MAFSGFEHYLSGLCIARVALEPVFFFLSPALHCIGRSRELYGFWVGFTGGLTAYCI